MKKSTYERKIEQVLDCSQFLRLDNATDDIVSKIEKKINGILLEMKKQDLISDKIFQNLRTIGAQPARLNGLAKVHKNETPLRPILSIPGSSYHNLNKFFTPLFEKVPGANIETSTLETRKKLEMLVLDENEQTISLDVKSLYTNVPVSEAMEIALRSLYSGDDAPQIDKSTLKLLLKLAVTNVHFKSNNTWYCQKDGLAMGASLAVILANIWMKSFEDQLNKESETETEKIKSKGLECPDCRKRVAWNSKAVECEKWFHIVCQNLSKEQYDQMGDVVWFCSHCKK